MEVNKTLRIIRKTPQENLMKNTKDPSSCLDLVTWYVQNSKNSQGTKISKSRSGTIHKVLAHLSTKIHNLSHNINF